jgi:hypothetical protein
MAKIFASLLEGLRRWLGWQTRGVDSQATSLLLSQPLDVLFEILEYLPPVSSVALALTRKLAFRAFFPAMKSRLDAQGLQNLLLLLEESVSWDFFFCHGCTQLHRFSYSWAPGCRQKSSLEPPCKPDINSFGDLYIGFHHVRLVMNAHFFGPRRGLSLSRLETKILPYCNGWETSSMAQIIQDQLFLCISHQLLLHQDRYLNRLALKSTYNHYICHHITTHPCRRNPRDLYAVLPTRIPELSPPGDGISYGDVKNCDSLPGSCSVRLTDFTTTVKQRRTNADNSEQELLHVTIVSYHQLGHCRSPFDWKWQTFSTRYSRYPPDLITRAQYLGSYHEPGAVKRRWDMDTLYPATTKLEREARFGGRLGEED